MYPCVKTQLRSFSQIMISFLTNFGKLSMSITYKIYYGPVRLAGLISGSNSGSSREDLPNVFLKEPFFYKKQRSRRHFGEATNCGSSKTALAPLKEPLRRSHAKHPLILLKTHYHNSHMF